MEKRKIKKYLLNLVKFILFILMVVMIYYQLKNRGDDGNLWETFMAQFNWKRVPFLIFALALMPVNWFLESIKWQTFISKFQRNFSITKSYESVICGTFFAFITPNRIAEFGGRLNKIDKENWPKALTAGFWGGIAQFLIIFSIGLYMGWKALLNFTGLEKSSEWIFTLSLIIAGLSLFIFFKLKFFILLVDKIPWIASKLSRFQFDFHMPRRSLFKVLFLTLFRYLVYVTQYVYVLYFLGVGLDYMVLFAAVSAMLFFHTIIPSIPFVDLGIKGNALLFLLKGQSSNDVAIALSVLIIWIINIIIPAIAGYIIFIKVKANNSENKTANLSDIS